MKPAHIVLIGFAVWLATYPPPAAPHVSSATHARRFCAHLDEVRTEPRRRNADLQELRRAAGNLASVVNDLQAARGQDSPAASHSVGNLWIEVDRLKRGGQDVRTIEWYVSELEGSSRGGQPDALARRHILNNLSYEIDALNRRP